MSTRPNNLNSFLLNSVKSENKNYSLSYFESNKIITWDAQTLIEKIAQLSLHFKKLGVNKGDRVSLQCETSVDWFLIDLSIMAIGGILIPIYPSASSSETEYILTDSHSKFYICDSKHQLEIWKSIANKCKNIQSTFTIGFESDTQSPCLNIKNLDYSVHESLDFYNESIFNLKDSDMATIVYTSGTQGLPKGVPFLNAQIMEYLTERYEYIDVDKNDVCLSYLPYSHIMGRTESWASIIKGFRLVFASELENLDKELVKVNPTFISAVPRVIEKFYERIHNKVETKILLKKINPWIKKFQKQIQYHFVNKKTPALNLVIPQLIINKFYSKKVKNIFGNQLRFILCGGAKLNEQINQFFNSCGVNIFEGYGLTETMGAVTMNTPLNYKIGSAGKPLKGIQIKIEEDNEILVSEKNHTNKYYVSDFIDSNLSQNVKDFENTEYYFKTGDRGYIDDEGFLWITSRKKELIKTSGAKIISPIKIESMLKQSTYIEEALVYGEGKKFIVALIVPSKNDILKFAIKENISHENYELLLKNSQIVNLIKNEVSEVNEQLASFETIKNYLIHPNSFSVESGELTPSLKLKRQYCIEKFEKYLLELFN